MYYLINSLELPTQEEELLMSVSFICFAKVLFLSEFNTFSIIFFTVLIYLRKSSLTEHLIIYSVCS
jgi:hypothetical protein